MGDPFAVVPDLLGTIEKNAADFQEEVEVRLEQAGVEWTWIREFGDAAALAVSHTLAIRGARKHERWGWLAINGLVSVAAAVVAMSFPMESIVVFAILFAAWAIVSGGASVIAGVGLGKSHGRWWLIAGGTIAIFFGVWAIFDLELGMLALAYLVGFQALLAGSTLLALAFNLRERKLEATADNTANVDAKAPRGADRG